MTRLADLTDLWINSTQPLDPIQFPYWLATNTLVPVNIDITGLNVLDLTNYKYNQVINLTSTNGAELITNITNLNTVGLEVKITVNVGLIVTFLAGGRGSTIINGNVGDNVVMYWDANLLAVMFKTPEVF